MIMIRIKKYTNTEHRLIANVQSQISGHTHVELIERTKQEQETKFITEYMMSNIASYMYLYDIILSNLLVTNVLVIKLVLHVHHSL
jgi:hypothetical protein